MPNPRSSGAIAVAASLVLHGAVLVAGAWIECRSAARTATPDRPQDSRFEARVVARADAEEEIVAPAPRIDECCRASAMRGGDASPALDPSEADDVAPPAAAPSIAVAGGTRGGAAPTEWSLRPTPSRAAFVGRGHGGRRADGAGSGGPPTVEAAATMAASAPVESAPAPPPAVRVAARLVHFDPPVYPESARDRGLVGSVRLEVDVLADGTVGCVRIVESSGVAAFDDAAVSAARRWRFAAATVDGVAVTSTVALPPIRFRLV